MSTIDTENIKEVISFVKSQLEDKKAIDVQVLSVAERTVLADYFIIAGGRTALQVKALAENIELALKKEYDLRPKHIEGMDSGHWVLLDYLDFVVHILQEEDRAFYSLEKLWERTSKS